MKRFFSYFSLALAGALLVGCKKDSAPAPAPNVPEQVATKPATVEPGHEAELIPLKTGNSWTYGLQTRVRINGQDQTTTPFDVVFKIINTEKTADGMKVYWTMSRLDKPTGTMKVTDKQIWLQNAKGIYQLGVGYPDFKYFSSPQPIIEYPIKSGHSFKWEGEGILNDGSIGKTTITSTILDNQDVDLESGRVNTIPVESMQNFETAKRSGSGISTVFIQPKVGIVRFKQQESVAQGLNAAVQILRLKEYKLN